MKHLLSILLLLTLALTAHAAYQGTLPGLCSWSAQTELNATLYLLANDSTTLDLADWRCGSWRVGLWNGGVDFPIPHVTPSTGGQYRTSLWTQGPYVLADTTLYLSDGTTRTLSGVPVPVSAVPEPAGVLALACGCVALRRWRR